MNAFPTDPTVRSLHSSVSGNALRASVLGANDGLVSSLSLVMGVAGAGLSSRTILITGVAGLLAGAGSMAMGEWISVQSSRERNEHELAVERAEIANQPELERQELVELYERRKVPALAARELADVLMADQDVALEVMAREELGFDPDELGGSPWTAAGSSFALFVAGALVPVVPFALAPVGGAALISVAVSALALLALGAAITKVTKRPALRSALRQLAIGLAAAALTYGTGLLLGTSL